MMFLFNLSFLPLSLIFTVPILFIKIFFMKRICLDFSDNIKEICGKESNKAKMGNSKIFSE